MANINQALRTLLTSNDSLNAIVKGVSPAKVSQLNVTYPRIVYKKSRKYTPYVVEGSAAGIPTAWFEVIIESISSAGYSDAQAAADVLRPVLNACRNQTVSGVRIKAVLIDDETEDYIEPMFADDVGVHQIIFDIAITYSESA